MFFVWPGQMPQFPSQCLERCLRAGGIARLFQPQQPIGQWLTGRAEQAVRLGTWLEF